jgi:DNA gyrase subunit A
VASRNGSYLIAVPTHHFFGGIAMERPDLSNLEPEIIAYIEYLEGQFASNSSPRSTSSPEPSEEPTTLNVITMTKNGVAKRSARHLYSRQRRGGMGVFDLETPEDSPPALLSIVDEGQVMLLFTNQGRAFRVRVGEMPASTELRAKGTSIIEHLPFRDHEEIIAALPEKDKDGNPMGVYVAMVSERGWIKRVRASYLGERMLQGMSFHNVTEGGYLVGACWTQGRDQIFMCSVNGLGIRFNEEQIPNTGCLGMRVSPDDRLMGVAPTSDDAGIFLMRAEGKGTIRLMEGFRLNKAPGAGGKVAMKANDVVGITAIKPEDDILAITSIGKIIRFNAGDVPQKTGVVQGVNCVNLRGDEVTAIVRSEG